MKSVQFLLASLFLYTSGVLSDHLTPNYPAPIDLSSDESLVSASWGKLSSTFDKYLNEKQSSTANVLAGIENVTFSVGAFSLHDSGAIKLQYHHTAPEIAHAKQGTNKVDADSIYRVASVSKLITTFTGLVEMTLADWNRPLADIIPGLGKYARAHSKDLNPLYNTQWDKITPWALATQLSGIATIGVPLSDLAVLLAIVAATTDESTLLEAFGLPPVNISALGPCATDFVRNNSNTFCSTPDGIAAVRDLPPNFLPWTTPAYSDEGFMLLGIAISNIVGKPISAVYRDAVFKPLGMKSSFSTHPTANPELAHSVIAGDPATGFAIETGFTTPSGGILSTISDLSKLGIGILNDTLLSAETTRKWMKPQTHTASLSYSIGAGLEIHRYVHPSTGRVTDLYTKLGDSGAYGGALVLIPQYDAGFAMLNAYSNGTVRSPAALVILDYVTDTLLPALEAQAAAEAHKNYVGTYVSSDPKLDTSITIGFNQSSVPGIISGLTITRWIFNGTDVLAGPFFNGYKPRLEPSIPKQIPVGSPGQVAFQASVNVQSLTYMAAMEKVDSGVIGTWTGFYATNEDFVSVESQYGRYGGASSNMFVFDVDGEGRATACRPAVDRVVLKRKAYNTSG
jgi:CubicO group peptidase (beta-lactamase class C family)